MSTSTDNGVKQRRGKTNESSTAASSSETPRRPSTRIHKFSAEEHLSKAEVTVKENKAAALTLYAQWRQHLQRISYLVVLVTFHMAQAPMTECLQDIKGVNEESQVIDGKQAIGMVLNESMCEIVGIVLTGSLAYFLSLNPHGDFSSTSYVFSCALIPLQLGLYFQTRRIGCTGDEELLNEGTAKRNFPVGIILHLMVTGAYWFMDKGMKKVNKNLKLVEDLRKELDAATKAKEEKAKKEGKK